MAVSWHKRSIETLPGSALPALQNLADRLVIELKNRKLTVAAAESCSAGALASTLAKADGANDVLIGGFVTYMSSAKTKILGVPEKLIAAHSAVSAPVARAMVNGVIEHAAADLALAVTGVTGPTPDDRGNPRGRVYIAAALHGRGIECHCEFGAFPPPVLLDAALRTALATSLEALEMRAVAEADRAEATK